MLKIYKIIISIIFLKLRKSLSFVRIFSLFVFVIAAIIISSSLINLPAFLSYKYNSAAFSASFSVKLYTVM